MWLKRTGQFYREVKWCADAHYFECFLNVSTHRLSKTHLHFLPNKLKKNLLKHPWMQGLLYAKPSRGRSQRNILDFFLEEVPMWKFQNLFCQARWGTHQAVPREEVNEWILIKSVSSVGVWSWPLSLNRGSRRTTPFFRKETYTSTQST